MSVPRRSRTGSTTASGLVAAIGITLIPAAAASASTSAGYHQAGSWRALSPRPRTAGPPAGIQASAAELANGRGRQLWGRLQYTERPIASITKIMTALVVLRAGHLGRYITISQTDVDYVLNNGASSAGLRAGDVLTTRQLLYAMLLPSGADAALALANSYGPGWHAFVRKMNAEARRLHLPGTHFTNFDGLQASDVSTPRNLLLLGEAVMRRPFFRQVVRRRWHYLPAGPRHHSYLWRNTNLLTRQYPGVIGIKTGWTPAAGECLLFEAAHRRRILIGVVLDSAPTNSGVTFIDAARLLNWGFDLHEPVTVPRMPPGGPTD